MVDVQEMANLSVDEINYSLIGRKIRRIDRMSHTITGEKKFVIQVEINENLVERIGFEYNPKIYHYHFNLLSSHDDIEGAVINEISISNKIIIKTDKGNIELEYINIFS